LDSVQAKGAYLRGELAAALKDVPHVVEVRGTGLICGVELDCPAGPVTSACMDAGLIVITAGAGNVVRLVPPLIITEEDIDKCVSILSAAVKGL
jgi:acetylornithine aminotransferase